MNTTEPDAAQAPTVGALIQSIDREDLVRTLVSAACTLAVSLGLTWPTPHLPAVAIIGLVVGAWPIVREALHDMLQRRMSMELSMLLAIAAAGAIGEWVTALLITTFVLAAEILEDLAMDRGRDAITDLMAFLPATVQVVEGDAVTDIPLDNVQPGQTIMVPPGGRIPVDGVVIAGVSTVDQSRITGESLPVEMSPGSEVFAGSINHVGALEIRAERVGADSSYGRIVEAVREAQSSQPPIQRLGDKLASYLVYIAIGGAILTYVMTRDAQATIAVIVVAGSCGVVAGTPLAILGAIARTARSGAFIKGGAHLETLSTIDTVMVDKTGTLTMGTPAVVHVDVVAPMTLERLLALAASAESYSEHPLGQAIVAHAMAPTSAPEEACDCCHDEAESGSAAQVPARSLAQAPAEQTGATALMAATDFTYQPGLGVTATVDGHHIAAGSQRLVTDAPSTSGHEHELATPVHIGVDGVYAGTLYLADQVRPTAKEAIARLHAAGFATVMITGDQEATAQGVAGQLGISEVRAGLMPEDKLATIDAQRAGGRRVVMVGDGVNDAPSLAHADVGIAMGTGTAIARESADVVLIRSDLNDLVDALLVARRARGIIMFNFVATIVIDGIGLALAGFGLLSPVVAALIHVGSETGLIGNSARLIPRLGAKTADTWTPPEVATLGASCCAND